MTVVELRGRLDNSTSDALARRMSDLLSRGRARLVLDMRDTLYVTSMGFRTLLIAAREVDQVQGKIVLARLSPELHRVFSLAGFTELFVIAASPEAAVISCRT